MTRFGGTLTYRFAIGYWALVFVSMGVIAGIVYFGTVGLLYENIDSVLSKQSMRLAATLQRGGVEAASAEITDLLSDNIDQDTEDYLLLSPSGQTLAGNMTSWPAVAALPLDHPANGNVARYGRPSYSRLLVRHLRDGYVLIVGRDLHYQLQIEQLGLEALGIGGLVSLGVAGAGAFFFRRKLESSVAAIRRTAGAIEAGDLSSRIPVFGDDDEFVRLNRDINRMLDRIERLIQEIKDVSNAIAHDLRTPLGHIRSRLDEALRPDAAKERLPDAAREAIENVDSVIATLDRLLQIAEAESGVSRRHFDRVDLGAVITDVVELYDAMAEANGVTLIAATTERLAALGDRNLIGSAVANLVDNSLKYAGKGATIWVGTEFSGDTVAVVVRDNGPGIPEAEREKVTQRFFRLDRSRTLPGNGLGLAIVAAIAELHWGRLVLEDANPGLLARIILPQADEYREAAS